MVHGKFIKTKQARSAHYVEQFLAKYDTPHVRQPPNSLDMVPYDFVYSPRMKNTLKSKRFKKWKRSNFNATQQQGIKRVSGSSRAARINVRKLKGPTSKTISPSSK